MNPRATSSLLHTSILSLSLSAAAACAGGEVDDASAGATEASATTSETSGTSIATGGFTTMTTASTTSDATTGDATTSASGEPTTTSATGEPPTTTTTTTGDPTGTTDTDTDTGGGELVCPQSVEAAILDCVADLQADPELAEGNFLLDLLLMCSDAEPVADDYDAHCAQFPADPICALDYPVFVEEVLPECIAGAQEIVFADVCLFPESYSDLLFVPGIALMDRREITGAGQLSPVEAEQLLLTSAAVGFPAATVDEAILATDDDAFTRLTVLDVGGDRVIVLYTAHYGDTRVGRAFFAGTQTIVGAVEDSFFTLCGVERGVEGQPCEAPADEMICGEGFACHGILKGEMPGEIVGAGACVHQGAIDGEGMSCPTDDHGACGPQSGLLCLALGYESAEGQCLSGWMRRSFTTAVDDTMLVKGGILQVPIVASGVATVPTTAHLDLTIGQGEVNALRVRLLNPLGTPTAVIDTGGMPTIDVVLDLHELPVPGDEPANGIWTLEVEDLGGNASGGVYKVMLMLDSRWD